MWKWNPADAHEALCRKCGAWQRLDLAEEILDGLIEDAEFRGEADTELLNIIDLFLECLDDQRFTKPDPAHELVNRRSGSLG
jgi:hypothetical protein